MYIISLVAFKYDCFYNKTIELPARTCLTQKNLKKYLAQDSKFRVLGTS